MTPSADHRQILPYFLVLALLSGCASAPRLLPLTEVAGPRDLIDLVHAHYDSLRTARIRSKVSLEIEGVRQKATSLVFFDRQDRLKMEVNGSLGISIMSASLRGDSMTVYLPGDHGYLDGPAARVLYQVTGMNLAFYDIQQVIMGLPTLQGAAEHVTSFKVRENHFVLDLDDGVLRKQIWIQRRGAVVSREDIFGARGELLSSLRLGDYTDVAGCRLPQSVEIRQGANHISWTVESAKVNEGIDASVFRLVMPPGTSRLDG